MQPQEPRRFTPSAAHRLIERPDKYHLALAFTALGIRRERQESLKFTEDIRPADEQA